MLEGLSLRSSAGGTGQVAAAEAAAVMEALLRDVVVAVEAGEGSCGCGCGCCSTRPYGAALSNHAEGVRNAMPDTHGSTVWLCGLLKPVPKLGCCCTPLRRA
ncbi:unnamed protein product, partial [Ectocarpus fasciculatus]